MAIKKYPQYETKFSNGLSSIAFDGGNAWIKIMDTDSQEGASDPHALVSISAHDFEREKSRHTGTEIAHAFFKFNGQCYVYGAVAYGFSANIEQTKSTGRGKFKRDYYGLLLVGALLKLYRGRIPEFLNVFGAHPPLDHDKKQALHDAIQGNWKIETFSGKQAFNVVKVDSTDEITGGALNVRMNINGTMNRNAVAAMNDGGEMLVLDLGGGTVDVCRLSSGLVPIAGTHKSTRIGLNECLLEFKYLFDVEFGHLMPNAADGVPMARVYETFLDKDKYMRKIAGEALNCQSIFEQATAPTLNKLYKAVSNMTGDIAFSATQALVTGGSGDLLFYELGMALFPQFVERGNYHRADEKGSGIFANVRGLGKLVKAIERAERQQARNY